MHVVTYLLSQAQHSETMAEHNHGTPLKRAEFSRESAGAAGAGPANHPTPETLYPEPVDAIRGNTHPGGRDTRRLGEAKEDCDGAISPSVAGTTQWLWDGYQTAGEGEGRGVCPAT